MGIPINPSGNLTATDGIAIKNDGHAHISQLSRFAFRIVIPDTRMTKKSLMSAAQHSALRQKRGILRHRQRSRR
jgi:hypothetical protein